MGTLALPSEARTCHHQARLSDRARLHAGKLSTGDTCEGILRSRARVAFVRGGPHNLISKESDQAQNLRMTQPDGGSLPRHGPHASPYPFLGRACLEGGLECISEAGSEGAPVAVVGGLLGEPDCGKEGGGVRGAAIAGGVRG